MILYKKHDTSVMCRVDVSDRIFSKFIQTTFENFSICTKPVFVSEKSVLYKNIKKVDGDIIFYIILFNSFKRKLSQDY